MIPRMRKLVVVSLSLALQTFATPGQTTPSWPLQRRGAAK
jgi:hypothetical protein